MHADNISQKILLKEKSKFKFRKRTFHNCAEIASNCGSTPFASGAYSTKHIKFFSETPPGDVVRGMKSSIYMNTVMA